MEKIKLTDAFIKNLEASEKRIEIYDTVVNNFCIRVTPNGSKSFVLRYYHSGTSKRYTIGTFPEINLAKARELARQVYLKVQAGEDPNYQRQVKRGRINNGIKFTDLVERYKVEHLSTLRPATVYGYKRIIERELIKPLGKLLVVDINRKHIQDILKPIIYKQNNPVYANRVQATLSSIFTFAVEDELIPFNFVKTVKKQKKYKGQDVEVKRDRVYTPDEIQRIWNAIDIETEPTRSFYMFLFLTGQRKSETAKARWENINLEQRLWTIPNTDTKNKRVHILPLSSEAVKLLEAIKERTGEGEWVFRSRYEDKPIKWMDKAKQRIAKRSGVLDFRPHDIRRTVATRIAELGTSEAVLKKILNHTDGSVTSIYNRHDYMMEKRNAMERWADRLIYFIEGGSAVVTPIEHQERKAENV